MKFTDFIEPLEEAGNVLTAKRVGIEIGILLKAYHDEYGAEEWTASQAKAIKSKWDTQVANRLQQALIRGGMMDKVGKNYVITSQGIKALSSYTAPDDDGAGVTIAKGVKNISTLRQKKFKVPKVGKNSKYLDQMKTILSHMETFASGSTKTTYMLAGDPGTGKTSFIKSLSTLTGIPLVIIEAPHITQEHLINIPFIVIDGAKTHTGNVQVEDETETGGQMRVVQAESNLVSQLKRKRKKTPEMIQKEINKSKALRDLQPQLQYGLDLIKDQYNSILFLDEFYRTSSITIRNVLRNILNGKIGNDKVPPGVYIVMATNINDQGVDDIPLNQDFHLMNYDVSSKDDFMTYMYSQYVSDPDDVTDAEGNVTPGAAVDTPTGVTVSEHVWNAFMDNLDDKDLGFNDENADVRLSPRRLEQMIIGLDAMMPVKNEAEAAMVLAFVKNNMTNYLDEASSMLLGKFQQIAIDIMKATGADTLDFEKIAKQPVKKSQWRDQLQSEIEMKVKLGENRKYIPVVSGMPGIGKTSHLESISQSLNMGFIQIDVANITTEDITGMPIANTEQGVDNITTKFSEPNLYMTIMKEYNAKIDEFRVEGRKYNMVLLFDELNRPKLPVFNAIRKVLLEREFENVKLPDDIIVTGAINPHDIGTQEFTAHTRDVLDIIPSSGSYPATINYIKGSQKLIAISDNIGFDLHIAVANIMDSLAMEFKSSKGMSGGEEIELDDPDVHPFWWSDGANLFYVSPREMTECVANATGQVRHALGYMKYDPTVKYDDKQIDLFIDEAINVTAKRFVESFSMIVLKQEYVGFAELLGMKIVNNSQYRKAFEIIRNSKNPNAITLQQIINAYDGDISMIGKSDLGPYTEIFSATDFNQDINPIIEGYMRNEEGVTILDKILTLHSNLDKVLAKLDKTASHRDIMRKSITDKVIALMKSDRIPFSEIVSNANVANKLKVLTSTKE